MTRVSSRIASTLVSVCMVALLPGCVPSDGADGLEVAVSVPVAHDTAYDGRLILLISSDTTDASEPRFQLRSERHRTAQAFGIDVEGWQAGEAAVFDASVFGFPHPGLASVPAGTYRVQAVLNRYETFELSRLSAPFSSP